MRRYQTVFECDIEGCGRVESLEGQAGDGHLPPYWTEVTVEAHQADETTATMEEEAHVCPEHGNAADNPDAIQVVRAAYSSSWRGASEEGAA